MQVAPVPNTSPRWIWILAIWFSVGLFDATQTVFSMLAQGMHHAWLKLFITLLFEWVPIALATPLIVSLARSYPPTRLRSLKTWIVHVPTCCVVCLASSLWIAGFEQVLNPWATPTGPGPFLPRVSYRFWSGLVSYFVLYVAVLGISYALDSKERLAREQTETARLSAALSSAQLNALRLQIEPHFLFNTLNAIAGLIREGQGEAATNMLAGLSDFLRRVVEDTKSQEIPLSEEMEFLHRYLEIQKTRFAERLLITVQVPDELLESQVPSFILQPMVENAIRHGIAKRVQGGELRISASRLNGMMTLRIYNDGPPLAPAQQNGQSGIGIANVRSRLETLYGSSFQFSLKNHGPHGVEAVISLPFRKNS
ncbi:MAG TPA: histidine kinase [Terriglobales bacterium]|nr:histidine kinase [Terriglobales bacterium]